jgi:hypothetical protein
MGRVRGTLLFALALAVLLELLLAAAVLFWPEFLANMRRSARWPRTCRCWARRVRRSTRQGFPAYVLVQHFFKGCNALGTPRRCCSRRRPSRARRTAARSSSCSRGRSRARACSRALARGALALTLPIVLTSLTIPLLGARVDEYEPYGPYLACAALPDAVPAGVYT